MALKLPVRVMRQEPQLPVRLVREDTPAADTAVPESSLWWLDRAPEGLRSLALAVDEHIRTGRFQRSLSLIAGLSSVLSGLEVAYEHLSLIHI